MHDLLHEVPLRIQVAQHLFLPRPFSFDQSSMGKLRVKTQNLVTVTSALPTAPPTPIPKVLNLLDPALTVGGVTNAGPALLRFRFRCEVALLFNQRGALGFQQPLVPLLSFVCPLLSSKGLDSGSRKSA
ncbi:hypothetical protein KFL_001050075 [Klebsormidium nitens]|uniref:Uncharacterized protein n=1 Tax=Klebsormidium nitens TaxID=105231 RepID=A0A1Y1HVQ1_KLENI|nr:hypothetical protein KFL_001050075 [Klebsormidium nitens]|eukprot:GAQ82243.1 hypothetical protein KFL_001050075 [Klebsormidium nitens]